MIKFQPRAHLPLTYVFIEVTLIYNVDRFYVYKVIFLLLYTLHCAHHQNFVSTCYHTFDPLCHFTLPTKPNQTTCKQTHRCENRTGGSLTFQRRSQPPFWLWSAHLAEMWLSVPLSFSPMSVSWTFLPYLFAMCRRITNSNGIYNWIHTHVHTYKLLTIQIMTPNK